MWLLLPIKAFDLAKQRLAGLLSACERGGLAYAMAADVLSEAVRCRLVSRVVVCSGDQRAESLARERGASFLDEDPMGCASFAELMTRALTRLAAEGADECAVVHGDLPLLTCAELEAFLIAHQGGGSRALTIAPDRHRLGSNVLAVRPLHGFEAQYGKHSFECHKEWAASRGMRVNVRELPGASLDIDEPEDLRKFALDMRPDVGVDTKRFLAASGVLDRLLKPEAHRRQPPAHAEALTLE